VIKINLSFQFGRSESGFPVPSYQRKGLGGSCSVLGVVWYREGVLMAMPIEGIENGILLLSLLTMLLNIKFYLFFLKTVILLPTIKYPE